MGYGDYCLLISVRDAPARSSPVNQLTTDFSQSMIASAVRRGSIEIADDGTVRLTANGQAAIERFPIEKSAELYRQLDTEHE